MTLYELAEESIANPSLNKSALKQNGKHCYYVQAFNGMIIASLVCYVCFVSMSYVRASERATVRACMGACVGGCVRACEGVERLVLNV